MACFHAPPRWDERWRPGRSKKLQIAGYMGEGVSCLAWSPGDGRLAVGGELGAVVMHGV